MNKLKFTSYVLIFNFLVSNLFANDLKNIESAIGFNKPIVGGYTYKFSLYLSKSENVNKSIEGITANILDEKNLNLISKLNESGEYYLSKNDNQYLVKSIWKEESEENNLYTNNIKTYSKNPISFNLNYNIKINDINNKGCLNMFYSYKTLTEVKVEKIGNETIYIFSTVKKDSIYNCLNIKNNVFYVIDNVNYKSFLNLLNDKLENYSKNTSNNDAYLLLKIEKE